MPRLPRISPIGIPVHVIQRGNNRQACFKRKINFTLTPPSLHAMQALPIMDRACSFCSPYPKPVD
ncbi:MAG: hypothetical protein D3916_15460 [Candidatus Electrothrix sp. MAN1_4]|nr:hypothetical protein [Candidatus Electrothrix sp. MAN1_4]